jgi:transposase
MKFIQGSNRDQIQMMCLNDYISTDNAVRFIEAFVQKIELDKIGIIQHPTPKQQHAKYNLGGAPQYHPSLFLKLYLYGYLNKIRSSRKLELECTRNLELRWLMQEIVPNYHSIADFRKNNPTALKALFKLFVQFMCDANLIGKTTIALDGSKFRAVNSKKNNYNQKKIDKHQQFIEDKTNAYLQQLDELDKQENKTDVDSLQREKINEGLQKLAERKLKYDTLQAQLDASDEKQISTTDADSRALIINKNIVEVAYNNQCVVDDKHNLIIHTQATRANDAQALSHHTQAAMQNIEATTIAVLADKGYHNGKQLHQCHAVGIETIVAQKEQPSVKHLDDIFLISNFIYNQSNNTYTCPAWQTLSTKGSWHNKKRETGETSYRFQKYTTTACTTCSLKNKCTKRKNRELERSEYQDAVDKNNNTQNQNMEKYKRRQAIVEHPFGTIKRQWGYTYTLLKSLHKVNGEMNLIMLCYNIKRTINILGQATLLNNLKNWTPDYSKVFCLNKNQVNKLNLSQIHPSIFLPTYSSSIYQVA